MLGTFDGDPHPDLAIASADSGQVAILLGDGTGSFTELARYGGLQPITSMVATDTNGDGIVDLIVLSPDAGAAGRLVMSSALGGAAVLTGDGTGHFLAPILFGPIVTPAGFAVANLDADHKPDLVFVSASQSVLTILKNLAH